MVVINDPNYLKYMVSFDANGAWTGTVQRTTIFNQLRATLNSGP